MAELIKPNFNLGKNQSERTDPDKNKPAPVVLLESKREIRDFSNDAASLSKRLGVLKTEMALTGGSREGFDPEVDAVLSSLDNLDNKLAEGIFNREIEHSYAEETFFDSMMATVTEEDKAAASTLLKELDKELSDLAEIQEKVHALKEEAQLAFGEED